MKDKRNFLVKLLAIIMTIIMAISIMTCVISINRISAQNSENDSHVISSMVSNAIQNSFLKPITVSETMCQDYSLEQYLITSGEVSPYEPEEEVAAYLRSICDGFGYQMVFAVCDKSKAYYTYDGISKFIDPENNDHDIWYQLYLEEGKHYDLDVDTDEANNWDLSVFVNTEIIDDEGNFLGVVGVGVEMVELQKLLEQYEKDYNIKINLIDHTGFVQIDTDGSKIENSYLDNSYLDKVTGGEYYYEKLDGVSRVTTFLDDLDWYLVVQDNEPNKIDVAQVVLPSIFTFVIGIIIIGAIFYIVSAREAKLQEKTVQLDSANTAKSMFLARMSHEIRTPINAVIGNAELILQETKEAATKEYAQDANAAAKSLLSIINDILDISKIEEGKLSIVPVEYSLSQMLKDVINLMKFKVDAKNLNFQYHIATNIPDKLYGDDIRLRQIIVNILNNAVKYTEKGGVDLYVLMESKKDSEVELIIKVDDTGIGIREEDMEKICKPFERLEEKRNRGIEGTGLGMGITAQLLQMMDSRLQIKSVYGEGSSFYFHLKQTIVEDVPIGDFKEKLKEGMSFQQQELFTAPNAKVLVVDDNEMNLKVISNLLKKTQIHVTTATSGKQSLQLAAENYYDVIFMDHMMPEMDGIETLQRLKQMKDSPNIHTPVIALTANAIVGAKEMYLEAGFDAFLTKPIFPEELYRFLQNTLASELIEVHTQPTQSEEMQEERITELQPVNGLDWNIARMHFEDDASMLEMVRFFDRNIRHDYDELYGYLQQIDQEGMCSAFQVKVHSMKNSAMTVGIFTLGGMAKVLEDAARDGNKEKLRQIAPLFLSEWLGCREELARVFDVQADACKKEKAVDCQEAVDTILQALYNAAQDLDIDRLDAAMKQLEQYDFGTDTDWLYNLREAVDQFDVDAVMARIEAYKK